MTVHRNLTDDQKAEGFFIGAQNASLRREKQFVATPEKRAVDRARERQDMVDRFGFDPGEDSSSSPQERARQELYRDDRQG